MKWTTIIHEPSGIGQYDESGRVYVSKPMVIPEGKRALVTLSGVGGLERYEKDGRPVEEGEEPDTLVMVCPCAELHRLEFPDDSGVQDSEASCGTSLDFLSKERQMIDKPPESIYKVRQGGCSVSVSANNTDVEIDKPGVYVWHFCETDQLTTAKLRYTII